jgi:hypothetical protein
MTCGCQKNRVPPAGASAPDPSGRSTQGIGQPVELPGQKFELTTHSGGTETFGSRLEANAARVRAGGGSIRPVR